jgi:hypothetical protein
MTMYGSEYDGSDGGLWDETDESCVNCCDPETYYYNGENLCEDCLVTKFRPEIDAIARGFLVQNSVAPELLAENMADLQVGMIDNPKNRDFCGVYLIFDYEREISLQELEANSRFVEGKKNNMGEIV